MNQVSDILNLAAQTQQQNIDAVLATVVRTEGSAYRQAGAMMLICADGRSVGMISGGCLEPHIIKRAFWLTRHGATVQVYQTGEDIEYNDNGDATLSVEDSLTIKDDNRHDNEVLDGDLNTDLDAELDGELNFGLGCNGRVHVLFERIATATPLLDLICQVRSTQQPVMIATLIKSNRPQYQTGMRINLDAYLSTGQLTAIDTNQVFSEDFSSIIGDVEKLSEYKFNKKNAEYVIIKSDVQKRTEDGNERQLKQKTRQENVQTEWLVQQICPQIRLLICGAGNDVMPLVTMAKLQDWQVTVIDSRPQYATRTRFPQADTIMCLSLDDAETLIELSSNAAVAVMSHSLTQDRARLKVLLEYSSQCQYIGQLGPRYRTERLIKEISAATANPAILAEGISRLHYPIGYKLGGDGPEALALSIMAQMSAMIHGQTLQATHSNSKNSTQSSMQQTLMQPLSAHKHTDNDTNDYAHN